MPHDDRLLWLFLLLVYVAVQEFLVFCYTGSFAFSPMLAAICIIYLAGLVHGSFSERYELKLKARYILLGFGYFLLSLFIIVLLGLLFRALTGAQLFEQFSHRVLFSPKVHSNNYIIFYVFKRLLSSLGMLGLMFIFAILAVVALVEEIVFRGVILDAVKQLASVLVSERTALAVAVVFQAALFAVLHLACWNLAALGKQYWPVVLSVVLELAALGIILAWARLRTGSLAVSAACHFFYDACVVLAMFLYFRLV
ncbi:MAG: CPBP family intramembrane metalloprotease [bacterium]|nr:CPBP family intramembrane metalloprotease [bacterium]